MKILYNIIVVLRAGVAQLVEQLIRNQQVAGSSPATSSKKTPQSDEFRSAAFYFYALPGWAARLYVNQYGGRAEESARPPYYLFGFNRLRLGGQGAVVRYRDKALRKFVLAAAAYIKIADDREGQRADKVDEQILHRVQQTNVEIPA